VASWRVVAAPEVHERLVHRRQAQPDLSPGRGAAGPDFFPEYRWPMAGAGAEDGPAWR
jgi:hypothetical protein